MSKDNQVSCFNCRYYQAGLQKDPGTCRFNPPTAGGFPVVEAGSWCRKHDRIESDTIGVSNGAAASKETAIVFGA